MIDTECWMFQNQVSRIQNPVSLFPQKNYQLSMVNCQRKHRPKLPGLKAMGQTGWEPWDYGSNKIGP
jgi:hypothetical protein